MRITYAKARRARGMSLMELLVVVSIIGLLATMAVPSLLMFRDIMMQSASQQIIETISTAIEQYHGDFNRNFAHSYEAYPPSDDPGGTAGRYLLPDRKSTRLNSSHYS